VGDLLDGESRPEHDPVDTDAGRDTMDAPETHIEPARTPRTIAKGKVRATARNADLKTKATVYPAESLYEEAMRLGRKMGGKSTNDCLILMLEIGVEAARRRALKPDLMESASLETHDMAATLLAYVMETAAHLDVPITQNVLDERRAAIIRKVRRKQ
jgi:hypothetical protein